MSITIQQSQQKPAIGAIWNRGLTAAGGATVVNALLFFMGSSFTFPPEALTPMGQPITIGPVVVMTLLAGVAATVGYTIFTRYWVPIMANRITWVGAAVVLVGMFFSPFGIENASAAQVVILEIMHLVAGLVPVYFLIRA